MRRYIYIHGTPEDQPLGVPGSHGCIRMSNTDVIELFELVPAGTEVLIREGGAA
jgi:lipoprotein-anchoring transpeptidase ErfK/SrfK